jgi:uncharacterized secreted protein with C-terminal beta-propeller domain
MTLPSDSEVQIAVGQTQRNAAVMRENTRFSPTNRQVKFIAIADIN